MLIAEPNLTLNERAGRAAGLYPSLGQLPPVKYGDHG